MRCVLPLFSAYCTCYSGFQRRGKTGVESPVDIVTDLHEIRRRAAQRHDEFEVMRYMLELNEDLSDANLDSLVDTVAAPIIAAIDCTRCANCCRSLDVALNPADADRLAQGINIPL